MRLVSLALIFLFQSSQEACLFELTKFILTRFEFCFVYLALCDIVLYLLIVIIYGPSTCLSKIVVLFFCFIIN